MVKQFKHSESGRTMLEMLGVLGIMGIIMYGAIAGINYGMSTFKINQTYNEVQEAIQGIQDLFSWSPKYTGLNSGGNALICNNDIFSCDESNNIKNSFNGDINVVGYDDTFTITYENVDQASCNRLKEMDWGTVLMDENSCNGAHSTDAIFCPKDSANQTHCED